MRFAGTGTSGNQKILGLIDPFTGLKPLYGVSIQFSVSIIVESKNKKRILKELSYVGIGADYIYPELEYTAKEIKRRFE